MSSINLSQLCQTLENAYEQGYNDWLNMIGRPTRFSEPELKTHFNVYLNLRLEQIYRNHRFLPQFHSVELAGNLSHVLDVEVRPSLNDLYEVSTEEESDCTTTEVLSADEASDDDDDWIPNFNLMSTDENLNDLE